MAKGGPLKGALVGKHLLTCAVERRAEDGDSYRLGVARIHRLDKDAPPRSVDCDIGNLPPLYWHVGHGAFWLSEEYRTVGISVRVSNLLRYDLGSLLKGTSPPWHTSFSNETPVTRERYRAPRTLEGYRYRTHHDYLPAGPLAVRQFVLAERPGKGKPGVDAEGVPFAPGPTRWSFTVHRYQTRWDAKAKRWQQGRWVEEGSIQVGFREPFWALGRGEDFYFVTRSGRLYRAPRPAKGKDRSIEAVWDAPGRPITAMLSDAGSGRSFLFVPPAAAKGRPAFFELAPKPKLVEYDPAAVPLPRSAGPDRTLLHLARVLVALKKVKAE
jgi:hypothetical protein